MDKGGRAAPLVLKIGDSIVVADRHDGGRQRAGTIGCFVMMRGGQGKVYALTASHLFDGDFLETVMTSGGHPIGKVVGPVEHSSKGVPAQAESGIGLVELEALVQFDPRLGRDECGVPIGLTISQDQRPAVGLQVRKAGAATGWTNGTVVSAQSAAIVIDPCHNGQVIADVIEIEPANDTHVFSADGDCGAIVVTAQNEAVGMVVGVRDGRTVAVPLSDVLDHNKLRVVTPSPVSTKSALRTARLEQDGLGALCDALGGKMGHQLARAVEAMREVDGRVIVTGIGKSGHVGQKLAATFASTGTPSFFVHPSEASHGDLGMIMPQDLILALSWSGETVELANILTYSRRFAVPLISITSSAESALGRASDICLELPRAQEACPYGLAPTTSTTMTLVLGDCLAIALLEAKGFSAHDFKEFHPGGSLGAQLKFVADIMHTGDALPLVCDKAVMSEALVTMTHKGFGCVGIVDSEANLIGMITDGDLRRHMGEDLLTAQAGDIMTQRPKSVKADMLASAAMEAINAASITALFVVDNGKPIGIVHVHDLLRAGLG